MSSFSYFLRHISDYDILSMYITVGLLLPSQILTLKKVIDFLQMGCEQNIHMPIATARRPFKFMTSL